jgi:hypothetical protein|tara:strand:+ start:1435 stop:1641 length:207 start_codon:yes stop_codon:yes gene_type:complete
MKYQGQVRVSRQENMSLDNPQGMTWMSVSPTKGKPYEYDTEEEAYHMLNICYPCKITREVRTIEIEEK